MKLIHRILTGVLAIAWTCTSSINATAGPVQTPPSSRPNIILVLTDDQDLLLGAMDVMPLVQSHLAEQGMTFTQHLVPQPLCCPARVSLLRGQYAHNHQVYTNLPPDGGFPVAFALGLEHATVATALHDAGYRTALLGKYLNGYPLPQDPTYVPRGWDEWFSPITNSAYGSYDYTVNDNGRLVAYGNRPQDYITDVLAGEAVSFITRTVTLSPGAPFFLALHFYAPHSPSVPAPRHWSMFRDAQAPRTPSFDEADMSDKPAFMQVYPPLTPTQIAEIDREYGKRLASLQAVDEAVDRIVRTLRDMGQLDNTYIVFTSDNGYHLGQHRIQSGKGTPYEEDLRVPLVVRGPGVPAGVTSDDLTALIDLAPTFAELAGANLPVTADGRSLVPLLRNQTPVPRWRQSLLIEYYRTDTDQAALPPGNWEPPDAADVQARQLNLARVAFTGLRTSRYVYTERAGAESELYDLLHDPYQIHNQWSNVSPAFRTQLAAALAAYRTCAGFSCQTAGEATPPAYQLNNFPRRFLPSIRVK